MDLQFATPAAVRSIVQRDMLNTWLRVRRAHQGAVPIDNYAPPRLTEEKKDLVFYDVKKAAEGWDFIIASKGSSAAKAYGTAGDDNRGTRLYDYLRAEMRPLVLPLYEACASYGLPVYSSSVLKDVNGSGVIYERLLLPFHQNGEVHQILASLKAISEEGKFEIVNLLRNRDEPPQYTLRALIKEDSVAAISVQDAVVGADDLIEI